MCLILSVRPHHALILVWTGKQTTALRSGNVSKKKCLHHSASHPLQGPFFPSSLRSSSPFFFFFSFLFLGLDVDNEEIHGVYRSVPETKVISRLIWWGSNDNNISTPIWIKLESPKDKASLPLCCSLLLQQGEAQPLCPLASDPRLTWPHVTTCLLNADTPECPQSR